jgi:hypothetical protein
MATFPTLSTGAVAQYPLGMGSSYAVETIQFLDGSQQRCLTRGKKLRRWVVRLEQLSELELAQIEEFFDVMQGDYGVFTFTDPFTGAVVNNCRLSSSTAATEYLGLGSGRTALVIEETNG